MSVTATLRRLEADVGELIARHDTARGASEFTQYASDPVGFARDVLRARFWSAQVEIAEAVRDCPLVVVRSGNGAGKDFTAASLALWWVFARGGLVLLTGPTLRQVREIVMGEVGRAFGRAGDLPGELYTGALRLGDADGAGILAFTSSESSKLTGFHHKRLLILLTEAQACEGFTYEAALACAVGAESRVLAVGNPLSPSGRFWEACRGPHWHEIAISSLDCPNVVEGTERIPGMMTREGVRRIEEEYGKGSAIYQARVLGEFPEQSAYGLVRLPWLEAAAERYESGDMAQEAGREAPVLAVDPARFGNDATAVCVRRGPILESITTWRKLDTQETAARVIEQANALGINPTTYRWGSRGSIVVDAIGVGGGVVDALRAADYEVTEYNSGRPPRDKSRFLNVRAESYWSLARRLESGKVAMPHDAHLWDELMGTTWKPTTTGLIQLEAKDDLRARLGRSPDRADAAVMAFSGEESRNVWGLVEVGI